MNNQIFSVRDVVKQGLAKTWQCKWAALGLVFSTIVGFLLTAGFFFGIMWLIDWAVAYKISSSFVAMIGLAGIDSLREFVPYFHMIVYGVLGLMFAGVVFAALMRYWLFKLFIVQANHGRVTWRDVMADYKGFWPIFWAQALLHISMYVVVFLTAFFIVLPFFGIAVFFDKFYLLLLIPIALITLGVMIVIMWLRLRYFPCFAIDRQSSALESLALSYVATKGLWFKILQYLLLYILMFMGLFVFRGLASLVPGDTLGLIIRLIAVLVYFFAFLMLTAGIYASDVYVYTMLKQEPPTSSVL